VGLGESCWELRWHAEGRRSHNVQWRSGFLGAKESKAINELWNGEMKIESAHASTTTEMNSNRWSLMDKQWQS